VNFIDVALNVVASATLFPSLSTNLTFHKLSAFVVVKAKLYNLTLHSVASTLILANSTSLSHFDNNLESTASVSIDIVPLEATISKLAEFGCAVVLLTVLLFVKSTKLMYQTPQFNANVVAVIFAVHSLMLALTSISAVVLELTVKLNPLNTTSTSVANV
jgi:hypothetical protein